MSGWAWYRLSGRLRDLVAPGRARARALRRSLSILLYRARALRRALPPRVIVVEGPGGEGRLIPHPAVLVVPSAGTSRAAVAAYLEGQTECSVTLDESSSAPYVHLVGGALGTLPPTHLESLLLAAVTEDVAWAAAGPAAPPPTLSHAPEILVPSAVDQSSLLLLRRPAVGERPAEPVQGRLVPHITSPPEPAIPWRASAHLPSGPYLLRGDVAPGRVIRNEATSPAVTLGKLPGTPGPRTVLFLLPFLAVGGAERLLVDLLDGIGARARCLVVTVEPHRAALGQTVDQLTRLTPHVYTLADWLPRVSLPGALRHLLRRYRVDTLVSWNGTSLFFQEAAALRAEYPDLHVVSQLFNHEGGWIVHHTPRVVGAVDRHVAVNRRIAWALEHRYGVPPERIALIHHGVAVPPAASIQARAQRRGEARRALGLPEDALIVGTFIRMHPQKRPADVLALARRLEGTGTHFLLVGGGPLDEALDRELAGRPLPNLTRLPMQRETGPLYDAVDVCLLTSAYEGLPVFLLDGLARGIPCVATAVGEIPLLLDGGGGVVVQRPGDLAAFAKALEALRDPKERQREGERGRAVVAERFGLGRFVSGYEEVLLP